MKGANAEVEVYPGTHHGFAFPKRPVYHRDAAERHWERLLALYRRRLSTMAGSQMTDIRIRDYQSSDAENLNRIAVAALPVSRQYQDWPAMLAGLSKTSALSADRGSHRRRTSGPACRRGRLFRTLQPQAAFFSTRAGRSSGCWWSIPRFAARDSAAR